MAHWLLKTEPETFSWDDQVQEGRQGRTLDRRAQSSGQEQPHEDEKRRARLFLSLGRSREIVGIVEVIREHYPDPTDPTGKFVVVDVKAVEPLSEAGDAR